jgi:hypothetical protein
MTPAPRLHLHVISHDVMFKQPSTVHKHLSQQTSLSQLHCYMIVKFLANNKMSEHIATGQTNVKKAKHAKSTLSTGEGIAPEPLNPIVVSIVISRSL